MKKSNLSLPGVEIIFPNSSYTKAEQAKLNDAIIKGLVTGIAKAGVLSNKSSLEKKNPRTNSAEEQSQGSDPIIVKSDAEAHENYTFAESMLDVIGREADMPPKESIKDGLQVLKDRQIIASAIASGYAAEAPITIRHFAKFRNRELASFYVSKAKAGGLTLHSVGHIEATGQYQARLTQDTHWNQLEISKVTVFLRRLAADFQGNYQGWTLNE